MKKFSTLITVIFVILAFAVSCASAPTQTDGEADGSDTTGPDLRVTFSPRYFAPDGDRDALAIFLSAMDESPIGSWKVEIHEPQPPYALFYQWEGQGAPPESLSWNGKSSAGELLQSAMDYPFKFTATDTLGNSSSIDTFVEVDVFVIREGENLRIQVPAIVFGSNSETWDNLDMATIATNDWVLKRIAQILTKFADYQVKVEGHANPTVNPNDSAGRQREQTRELLPLSEIRAMAIVDYLVKLGIDRQRLSSYGIGGSRPVAAWDDTNNWWKNRRVEFLLVK